MPHFPFSLTGSLLQPMRPCKQRYQLHSRDWTTPFNAQNHELGFQSAEQRKDSLFLCLPSLSICSQWPEALSWHTDRLTLECVGISKFITTSTCGMSRPLLATSVASKIERAFALNLFREPKRLFWKKNKREWESNTHSSFWLALVKILAQKNWGRNYSKISLLGFLF